MIATLFAFVLCTAQLPGPGLADDAVALGSNVLQDEGGGDVVDKRPEVAAQLDALDELVKARGEKDTEAIAVIATLVTEFPRSGPKDRASIVDAVAGTLDERRPELSDGTPQNRLYLAAATALGEMGSEAGRSLTKWIGNKRHRDDLALQRALVLSLGKLKDERYTKDLTGLLQHKEPVLQAAAAEAMANYKEAELSVRKGLFEDILKVLMSVKGRMDTDPNDTEARQRYDTIGGSMNTTLQVLSGQNISVPEEWQRWWNKNKRDDWDGEQP